jgi:hypothetical protein
MDDIFFLADIFFLIGALLWVAVPFAMLFMIIFEKWVLRTHFDAIRLIFGLFFGGWCLMMFALLSTRLCQIYLSGE